MLRNAVLAAAALMPVSGHAAPYTDAAQRLQRLYAPDPATRLWTGQAQLALDLLRAAPAHGLEPSLYDVEALSARLAALRPEDADSFDQALSGAMLQYLDDLHFGRVKPDVQLSQPDERLQHFDPVEHLRLALKQQGVAASVDAAEPTIPLYRRVKASLERYRGLAALKQASAASPEEQLRQRLLLLGDLDPADANPDLAPAIRRFQARHGLEESGKPNPDTTAALKVPLGHRVRQLALTLERLRWMPPLKPGRVIVVNVAAYRLWAFGAGEPLEMRVIVGKAVRTQTPLFIGQMSYLEFNPYWNVPRSIAVGEVIPKLSRNGNYLAKNNMEVVSLAGKVQGGAPAAAIAGLRAGTLRVRQRPGPHNVLGAVKFAMPNPMNIYLHSTAAKELFGKTRRDLSHGCIRVERPAELAAFVLADQPQWTADAIAAEMAPNPTRTVRLGAAIPVVLFYATAATDRAGQVLFANDIYRRDDKLAQAMQAR
jgi:murein L,D-transpeptidase YcbB/YkuD